MTVVTLNLNTAEHADASAKALEAAINEPSITVIVKSDELSAKHLLRIQRRQFGNIKVSSIDADFVHGPNYQVLSAAAATFKGLIGLCGKAKEIAIKVFHEAMNWLRDEVERGVSKQRYKGLGEMNPEQGCNCASR